MMIRVLLAAILAGLLAGAFATVAQSARVIPLILEAETYENAGVPDHGHEPATVAHDHEDEAWAPEDGLQRTFFTLLSNLVVGASFALLLTAAIMLLNQPISMRSGLLWGAGGFGAFVLAPNFGLPPELPGMPAGDLLERQIWWTATVAMTAGGLLMLALKRRLPWMLAGVALIVLPHIYGAPQAVSHDSDVPANLAAQFATASVVTSALFWLVLGGLLGAFLARAVKQEDFAGNHA
ncbi:CbtA family protein [Oricola cellulosilytica]|uniref:Cobalt transporter n=1 Tax=Oricola cellulosilytica TaxID=1429082 RepID=A0A4R0PHG3_9HYPH|nr:CbtA family protein [Oricola cellulosilytica]TCD15024.1 cobalt transporter [Oricola cellulosilytica]